MERTKFSHFTIMLLAFLLITSCKSTDEQGKTVKPEKQATEAIQDSAGMEQDAENPLTTGFEELEQRRANLEKQIETMMAELEAKEEELAKKEADYLAKQTVVDSLEAALQIKQKSLGQWQTVSWVILAVGVIALALAVVIFRRRSRKNETSSAKKTPTTESVSKPGKTEAQKPAAAKPSKESKGKTQNAKTTEDDGKKQSAAKN